MSPQTVLLRTTLTRTITIYRIMKLRNVSNHCLYSCKSTLWSSDYLYLPALFFFLTWFLYVINNTPFEETGQIQGSSAAAIQFSFRNRANFHYDFFDTNASSILFHLAACRFFCVLSPEVSSNLISWRPKETHRRAENQCHCCGIYHFQRPDLICKMPASDPANPPLTRFPCSREKSIS